MADIRITGSSRLADKLAKLSTRRLSQVVKGTTIDANERLQWRISNAIPPHNRKGATVTNLVDTGFYKAGWLISFPGPFKGRIATNVAYAGFLEEGTENMEGFFPAKTTAREHIPIFRDNMKKAISEMLQ